MQHLSLPSPDRGQVALISPASGLSKQDLDELLERAGRELPVWRGSLRTLPKRGNSLGYTAGAPEDRLSQIIACLQDDRVSTLWALRGGFGCVHLLQGLEQFALKLKKPLKTRRLVGFSDVTALFQMLAVSKACQKLNLSCFHGPLAENYFLNRPNVLSRRERAEVKSVVDHSAVDLGFKVLPLNGPAKALVKERANRQVELQGGNLTVLASLLGTPWGLGQKGGQSLSRRLSSRRVQKVLFLEDRGERAYRLDRTFHQLLLSGVFSQFDEIALGDFTEGKDPDGKDRCSLFLRSFFQKFDKPVFYKLPVGHGLKRRTLPLFQVGRAVGGNFEFEVPS